MLENYKDPHSNEPVEYEDFVITKCHPQYQLYSISRLDNTILPPELTGAFSSVNKAKQHIDNLIRKIKRELELSRSSRKVIVDAE
jgi:hypothetical protein